MQVHANGRRVLGRRDEMLYGHFIEHFHNQIYGGIYDPQSPFADKDGLRSDVLEALKRIRVPILRWPGGCFVSSYHWEEGVGKTRIPSFDKAWRVEDPNTFGTDEYIAMCRKIGCEPYICTNAGTGTAEEMSNWVEYCNLESEGRYARQRIANGHAQPHGVKYWSVGNENYGSWEIGAKSAEEWGRLVRESCKMIKHVDPTVRLSAAALSDVNWNINLLSNCSPWLDLISIHEYWDMTPEVNHLADYEQCMAFTPMADHAVREVRGLLCAMRLEHKIKIAFDEWNLRSWHHPNVHTRQMAVRKEDYIAPRDLNDDNSQYTMADAVFTACFLSAMNRHCDIVCMANFAPVLNTRGCIYTHEQGLVLRSTYHVFDLYVNRLGDTVIDSWQEDAPILEVFHKKGHQVQTDTVDVLATRWADRPGYALALVNKHPDAAQDVHITLADAQGEAVLYTVNAAHKDDYNDIGRTPVCTRHASLGAYKDGLCVRLEPHSVNVLQVGV